MEMDSIESPHAVSPEELVRLLNTHSKDGLSDEEATQRQSRFGLNQFDFKAPISAWDILFSQFKDLMVLILLIAAVIAFGAWYLSGQEGLPADAIVIAAILILNAGLGFVQEYRAEQTMQKLQEVASASDVQVVRDGHRLEVDRVELVPGDIVHLQEGDRVPADLVLLRADRLRVDESMLTGESESVTKSVGAVAHEAPVDSRTCSLFAGTTVTAGSATAVVTGTGQKTELGGLASTLAQTVAEETPLQRRLAVLGKQIGWGVLIITIVVGGTVLAIEQKSDPATLTRVLMFSVALAVAAVPEGLPAVMTVSLAVGTRQLANQQAVVRKMAAVETLGSVTAIVTDKTGTITHNQMTARFVFVDDEKRDVSGEGYGSEGGIEGGESDTLRRLLRAVVYANAGELAEKEGRRIALGDPVDAGLLVLAEKAGLDWRDLRTDLEELSCEPFSSERARMSSLRQEDDGVHLYIKGSLETLLERSKTILMSGREVPLDEERIARLKEVEADYASRALRVLAVAERLAHPGHAVDQEHDLVLLGLVVLGDPPRKEAKDAIEECRRAGIRVIMATGDHPATALAIARQVGLTEGDSVLTGPELEKLSDEELSREVQRHNVYARVSPAAKLRLVETLLRADEVVAMTGDGVNDAPALKKVHVGVSMGSGTAVAMEASDVVLLDDDFATIVNAIHGGRDVYRNVQKFIAFLFSGNFGVVLAMFLGAVFAGVFQLTDNEGLLLPLTAAQILWMNLAVDGAPAVAFSFSKSKEKVMKDPPRSPDSPILTRGLWIYLAFCGTFVALALLLVLDLFYKGGLVTTAPHSVEYARSAAFYMVVCTRLCNAFNFRHLPGTTFSRDFFADGWVPGAALLSWLLTLAVIFVPPMSALFGLVPLEFSTLFWLTVLSPLIIIPGEIYKRVIGVEMSEPLVKKQLQSA